jgi:hypothetical protein
MVLTISFVNETIKMVSPYATHTLPGFIFIDFQKFFIFILKRIFIVMFFLIKNILLYRNKLKKKNSKFF